jgi:adenine-specific DNA-methyltransferase
MTELTWEGKYKDGKRVGPVRVELPFQTIETVNESAQQRAHQLDLWHSGQPTEWRNRLIWGDKKYVLPSLLAEFRGQVNLIYIDPPFATGADFSFTATIPESGESFEKEPSMLEQKAYRDTWGRGLDSYLQWFYETVMLLRELLAEDGSIYVHCDWRVNSAVRLIMDEVFGPSNFRNEIVWVKNSLGAKGKAKQFPRNQDTILFYTKSDTYTFNKMTKEQAEPIEYANGKERLPSGYKVDQEGRYYWTSPKGDYTDESIAALRAEGRIEDTGTGNVRIKYFVQRRGNFLVKQRLVDDVWEDIQMIFRSQDTDFNYPTQKPEALLERIINASSNEGDLVLDCFCGSGTTAAVAEKLKRRWITCDLGRFAIHTTRKRLLSIENVQPFVVQNLGKYERQAWQVAEFGSVEEAAARQQAYRRFILQLYRAEPLSGYTWLHGVRAGRVVHVGAVDAPVSLGDVKAIAVEFWKAMGKGSGATSNGVDILGWDFAFELNEVAKQFAAESNIQMSFKRIPREVLEKKAVEQGDIKFFELAALSIKDPIPVKGLSLTVELTDFVVPPDDIPQDIQRAITNWTQWIDYWAVDWDYRGDAFHNQWQSYRTRQNPQLQKLVTHTYEEPGTYTIVIKVIDLLGNDTTRSVQVEVR